MVTIQEAQNKLLDLIRSRQSVKQLNITKIPKSPNKLLGEHMLNAFATQIINDSVGLEYDPTIEEELVESLLSTLALAGLIGVDLETKLEEILTLMEIATADSA